MNRAGLRGRQDTRLLARGKQPRSRPAPSRRRDGHQPSDGQAVPEQRIRRGNATHRRISFLPQEHGAGLILAVANLGEHLR